MMKNLVNSIPAFSLPGAMPGSPRVAASAARTAVGTVNGGGTAIMTDVAAAGFSGVSSFSMHATLFSDGSASGHFDCVDHMGNPPGYPGNIFGDITSWSKDAQGLHLYVTNGSLVGHGLHKARRGRAFTVTIQSFGGAGGGATGPWTSPGFQAPLTAAPSARSS